MLGPSPGLLPEQCHRQPVLVLMPSRCNAQATKPHGPRICALSSAIELLQILGPSLLAPITVHSLQLSQPISSLHWISSQPLRGLYRSSSQPISGLHGTPVSQSVACKIDCSLLIGQGP